jgi:Na+-driven multidrug efflux pump
MGHPFTVTRPALHAWGADAIWASFAFGSISAMLMLILYYQWAAWRGPFKATASAEPRAVQV